MNLVQVILAVLGVSILGMGILAWRLLEPQPQAPSKRVERRGSEQLIETWRQKYVVGEIEIEDFEEGVWRAMTGASDAATIAAAELIASSRPVPDADWFRLAHDRKLQDYREVQTFERSDGRIDWVTYTRSE